MGGEITACAWPDSWAVAGRPVGGPGSADPSCPLAALKSTASQPGKAPSLQAPRAATMLARDRIQTPIFPRRKRSAARQENSQRNPEAPPGTPTAGAGPQESEPRPPSVSLPPSRPTSPPCPPRPTPSTRPPQDPPAPPPALPRTGHRQEEKAEDEAAAAQSPRGTIHGWAWRRRDPSRARDGSGLSPAGPGDAGRLGGLATPPPPPRARSEERGRARSKEAVPRAWRSVHAQKPRALGAKGQSGRRTPE